MPAPINIKNIAKLPKLNLPLFDINVRSDSYGNAEIFDEFRKKYVILTHEEWVRQNFAVYMHKYLDYPIGRIKLEHQLVIAGNNRRCDIVYFDKSLNPEIIVECKSTKINISKSTFNQIALYNSALNVKYLIVTNGINHFAAEIDYSKNEYIFLDVIPEFNQIK